MDLFSKCKELYEKIRYFEYGIPVDDIIKPVPSPEYFAKNYHFLKPEEFEKYEGGICWDYVEYERKFLEVNDIDFNQYYLITNTPPNYDTHTFITVKDGDELIYIESSFKRVEHIIDGVQKFKTLEDIVRLITTNMWYCNDNDKHFDEFKYDVCKFKGHPQYGCTCEEYMKWMDDNSDIVIQDVSINPKKVNEDELTVEEFTVNKVDTKFTQFVCESTNDPEEYDETLHDHIDDEDDIYNESWTDFKNGVHPSSGLMFHVSLKNDMDGKTINPQLPSYITDGGKLDDNYQEDTKTKRLCVSPSIEGCLIAILNYNKIREHVGDKFYVYTPEKPFSQYKHKTNKEIVKDKLVFDANITKEAWILEPCKLKLYGIIKLKKVKDLKKKPTVEKNIKMNTIKLDYEWIMTPKASGKFNKAIGDSPDTDKLTVQESYIISKKNYEINMDKWKPGTPLWITGSSGDGKSTFANQLAKEKNAFLVPLDLFLVRIAKPKEKYEKFLDDKTGTIMNNGSQMILDYINEHPELPWADPDNKSNWGSRGQDPDLWNGLFNWLITTSANNPKYKSKLIIFEGCNICLMPIEKAVKLPFIIMGTSRLASSLRRIKRDHAEHSDYSIFKIVYREIQRSTNGTVASLNKAKDAFEKGLRNAKKDEDGERIEPGDPKHPSNKRVNESTNILVSNEEFFMEAHKMERRIQEAVSDLPSAESKDIYHNLDLWESGKCNLMWVTGLSGSGKSTIAKDISIADNSEHIELDDLQRAKLSKWDTTKCKMLDDYIKSKGGLDKIFPYINDIENPSFRDLVLNEGCAKQFNDLIKFIMMYAKIHKSKKYTVEGVQLAFYATDSIIEQISKYPVVIKMTSPLKAELRRIRRLIENKTEFKEIFKQVSKRMSNMMNEGFYKSDYKKIKDFKSNIGESYIIDEMNEEFFMEANKNLVKSLKILDYDPKTKTIKCDIPGYDGKPIKRVLFLIDDYISQEKGDGSVGSVASKKELLEQYRRNTRDPKKLKSIDADIEYLNTRDDDEWAISIPRKILKTRNLQNLITVNHELGHIYCRETPDEHVATDQWKEMQRWQRTRDEYNDVDRSVKNGDHAISTEELFADTYAADKVSAHALQKTDEKTFKKFKQDLYGYIKKAKVKQQKLLNRLKSLPNKLTEEEESGIKKQARDLVVEIRKLHKPGLPDSQQDPKALAMFKEVLKLEKKLDRSNDLPFEKNMIETDLYHIGDALDHYALAIKNLNIEHLTHDAYAKKKDRIKFESSSILISNEEFFDLTE